MKTVVFSGTHIRHRYFASSIEATGTVVHQFVETRESQVPERPPSRGSLDAIVNRHFVLRREAEEEFFGEALSLSQTLVESTHFSTKDATSIRHVVSILKSIRPDLLVCFGTKIIPAEIIQRVPVALNLHGGLSPWFRGAATMFWPSYFLMPAYTGTTLHYMIQSPDAGAIVHQTGSVMREGDGLQMFSTRTLAAGIHETRLLVEEFSKQGHIPKGQSQLTAGRLFLERDWQPAHCKLIYETYDDRIVDSYLNGELERREPKLVRDPLINN